eukprot:5450499-Amphidinium_carterae.1
MLNGSHNGQVWAAHQWAVAAPFGAGTFSIADQNGNPVGFTEAGDPVVVLHAGASSAVEVAGVDNFVRPLADEVGALVKELEDVEKLSDADCRKRLLEVRQTLANLVQKADTPAVHTPAPEHMPPAHAPPSFPAAPVPAPPPVPAAATPLLRAAPTTTPCYGETPWASPA